MTDISTDLIETLRTARRIAVLTGAGISTEMHNRMRIAHHSPAANCRKCLRNGARCALYLAADNQNTGLAS